MLETPTFWVAVAFLVFVVLAAKPVSMPLLICLIIVIICAITSKSEFEQWLRISQYWC